MSLTSNALYEAGGVLTWLNPLDSHGLPIDIPSFKQVVKAEQRLVPTQTQGQERIVWPVAMHTFIFEDHIPQDDYPSTLFVVSGHALVAAWWVAGLLPLWCFGCSLLSL